MNLWGIRRRPMPNRYGEYAEPVGSPYAAWKSVEEAESFPWPSPDWFDYRAMPALARNIPTRRLPWAALTSRISSTAWPSDGVWNRSCWTSPRTIPSTCSSSSGGTASTWATSSAIRRRAGRIDLVLCGDDFGSQRGLLISPASFDRLFAAKKKELFDLVHAFEAKVSHHCCGSSRRLVPAIHRVRHGRPANRAAAGRGHESL